MRRATWILWTALCLSTACGCSKDAPSQPAKSPSAERSGTAREKPTAGKTSDDPQRQDEEELAPFEPPPYPHEPLEGEEHDRVCAESVDPTSDYECSKDSDCRICHDGSACGVPVNLDELRRRGEACQQEDAAKCEYSAVRCCDGRCKVVGY